MKMELPTNCEILAAEAKDRLRIAEARYERERAVLDRIADVTYARRMAHAFNDLTVDECRALLGEAA